MDAELPKRQTSAVQLHCEADESSQKHLLVVSDIPPFFQSEIITTTTTTPTTTTTQFSEKVRIATGSKKSPKRLAIEVEGRERPYLGDDGTKRYLVMVGDNLVRGRDAIVRHIVKYQRTPLRCAAQEVTK